MKMRWPAFVALAAILLSLAVFRPESEKPTSAATFASSTPKMPQHLASLSPPVTAFREWFDEYKANPSTESLELGKAYAKQHTAEIAKLIVSDPQLAIESAVPMVMRQKLPKEIVALLEDRVRVRGDYEVYGNVPLEGQEASTEPYTRTVTGKDGKRWNAHVYGWRLSQRSRLNSSLNGVAVGREMAVSDSPVRVLEVGEVPQNDGREIVEACPISGIETPVEKAPDGSLTAVSEQTPAFETPERVIYVCSGGHITQIAEQYLANEEEQHWATLGTDLFAGAGSGPAHGPISGTIPSGWTLGNRSFLYIRACFPDNPVDPQNEQECHDMFKQANDYIVQNSYGRCYLTYAFPPLVVLPYPLEWYAKYDADVGGGDYLIQNHAIQIAKTMGYNNGSYNMWAVRWNNGPGAYGGSASVGGAGMRMKTSGVTTFLHELGHNLGVWHANRWQTSPPSFIGPGTNHEYGNYFDIMGSGGTSVNGHYTASFKNTLSWMPQEQFWNVTGSGLYRIHQVDASTADPSLRYALRIKKDAERDYWAEYRQRWTGIDSFMNGAMMTWDMWGIGGIGGSGGSPFNGSNRGAHLLDMTPGSFGNGVTDTRNDAGLYVGRTYSDPESNIHITPVAKNATTPPSLDMQVQIGNVAGNNAPTLGVSASTTTPAVSANVTLTATASDVDGDTLAYAWVFGDGTYSTNNSASQTKSWSTAGHYQVLCTASDMKGKRTTRAVLVTVGSPSTFTVSGNITGPDSLPLEGVYVANYAMSITTLHANSSTFKGTWTDSDGNYTLTGLAAGSYTITPNLYPYTFSGSGAVTVGPNATGKNFTSAIRPLLTISYPDDVAAEAAAPDTATIRITREGSTAADLVFQIYNANTGSATRNTDYTLTPAPTASTNDGGNGTSQYTIPAGSSFIDITVTPVNDSTAEGVEIASLDFANTAAGYYMAGDARARVSITDDESSLPVVRLTAVDDSGHEAGTDTLTMKIERNVVTASALTVNFSYSGTATRNADYSSPLSVSIPANSASTTFTITPVNDTDIETTETITCTVSTNAAYNRDGTAQAVTSILNDDDMPVVSIAATVPTASETGNAKGLFTISRTGGTAAALTVDFGVNGRAVLGTDYRRLEGRATIPAGFASTTVEIVPFDDAVDEGTQDVILQLRTSQSYFINPAAQTATVTISDNDASQVYIELNTGNGTEPASGSAGGPVFQIWRPASGTAITVNYTLSGTATSGVDFTALPGSIAFAAADTNRTIPVTMLADTAQEDAESITMTLSPGSGYSPLAGQNQSATGWIFDGDQPTVEVNAADSTGGLTAPFSETTSAGEDFLISRRVATASDLIVNYTMSGTATEGTDYTTLSGTATIPANATSVYVTVVPINDTTPEGVETVTMNITPAPGTYGVRVGSATMLLSDNDNFSSGSVAFAGASASTAEDVGVYNIPVNITGTPPGDVTVQYRVNGGSAAGNGIDFSLANGVLTFPSGTTTQNIAIEIIADQLPEPAETIVVQLLNQTGANLGTSSHTLTINNRSMPEAFTDPASAILANGATLNGRVNPGGLATDYWFEYGPTTAYGNVTATQSIAASNTLTAVTFAFTGGTPTTHFRLVAQNSTGSTYGINQAFTASNAPSAATLAATNVLVTTATLNGTANSNGLTGTSWFEWGTTNAYGNSTTPVALSASTSNVPVSFSLTGLTQATTYYFRTAVQSAVGTVYGGETTFTTGTPLVVRTGSATAAAQTGLLCDGYVNAGGVSTDWWFEYGTDTNYGEQTTPQTISGSTTQLVRLTLNSLTPGTEYHFRLVAQNVTTTGYGDDQTINTLELAPNAVVEPAFAFTGTGTAPQAPLTLAPDGTIWGTTSTGGTFNRGTAFKLSTGGTMSTLANFYGNSNSSDSGNGPNGNLTRAGDGNFYGTTNTGGTSNLGTIFRMTPAGEVTTLVSFTGTTGAYLGSNPINGLTLGNDGALYGVAQNSNSGYLFKITTGGVYTQLVAFTGTTGANLGANPRGNLVLGSDGNFYGTTAAGGTGGTGLGTVFKMTPAGVLTTLVNFTGTTGLALGATPTSGLVQHANGNFYGMTSAGGTGNLGTIFEITPGGVLTTLVNFTGGSGLWLGSAPKGTLTLGPDGLLYGTTTTGGTLGGFGTIFKVSTTGTLTTMVQFSGTTGTTLGSSPNGGLVLHPSGDYFGTTSAGGAHSSGTIFKMSGDGTLTTLLSCTPFPALGKLMQHTNGKFYGITSNGGGSTNVGMAFAMPAGGAPEILNVLTPVSGTTVWDSRGGFMQGSDGHLYATAGTGAGSSTNGGVYRMTTAGVLTNLITFTGTTGGNLGATPRSSLIQGHDGQLWGITATGGASNNGVIFKTTLAGVQTTLVQLTTSPGANPGSASTSPLLLHTDGNYYGATNTGGTGFANGTIFKLTPGGTHTVIYNMFTPAPGSNPTGFMVRGDDGLLYGVTSNGGTNSAGVVFRCTTAGEYTRLASFTGTTGDLPGSTPNGGLFRGPDGHFYGVTSAGGIYNAGTVFRVNRDGTVQSLYSLSGRDEGITSANGLATSTAGEFYGVSNTSAFRVNLPPVPLTLAASAVTANSAMLNGSVDANGESGSFWFEVNGTPTAAQSFTASTSTQNKSAALTGLAPLQTYRVKAVVTTSSGTFSSVEKTFTTLSTVNFASAGDVPVTSNDYTAGGTPSITLGFTPTSGQVLKLVQNTGFLPVTGTFNNLPEGSLITALNGPTPYTFEISYAGGDGNDITLTAVDEVITFPAIPVKYVGDAAFTLAATSSGASPVVYQVVAGAASASVSGNTITLTSTPGTVTVKANAGAALPKYQTFVLAAAGTGFTSISASKQGEWSLGIRANGTLWGWGTNTYGNLGDASTTQRRTLVQAGTATSWRQVSAGTDHAVGTRTDGTLWAWGRNNNGQAGQGSLTTTQYTSPTQIGTATDWAWVVAGANHCVAVKTDGTLWAWGLNSSGQIGQGSTSTTATLAPTRIGTGTTWAQTGAALHAGGDFTLALQTNGTLWAWGANASGQIGDASTTTRSAPVQVGTATTWTRVIAGASFSGALRTDGTLWVWGTNVNGMLGDGSLTNRTSPVQLGTDTNWNRLAAGNAFFLATRTNGTLWSWGFNGVGQLGQGTFEINSVGNTPKQIGTATNWQDISGGSNYAIATTTDGGLDAWGSSANSQLGWLPRTPLPLYQNLGPVQALAGGGSNHTALLRGDGSLWTLGSNGSGQLGIGLADSAHRPIASPIASGQTWRVISSGHSYIMAIRSDGSLWGTGLNSSGQLGDGTVINRSILTRIGSDSDWVAVCASSVSGGTPAHTLAVKADGSLWSWGNNASGQLGDGTMNNRFAPARVGTDSNWRAVFSTGGSHSLALKTDGTLWAWGLNTNGQVGNNTTTNVLAPVQVLADVQSAIGGSAHTHAIKTNGTLWGWGLNSSGQLGDASTTQRTLPVQVGSATNWNSVTSTNSTSSLGTRADGTLWAWGPGAFGQFGNGTFGTSNRTSPVQIGTSSAWRSVNSIGGHQLALTADGTAWGWGFSNGGPTAFAGHNQWSPDQVFPALSSPQTITFTAPSSVAIGNTITLAATASSGLPARYIVTGNASLNGDKLTVTGAGFISVIAYQPGDGYWQSSDIKHTYINLAAPSATTLAATNVTATSATLNATVNPNGAPTTAQFQSGTSISYGTNTPVTLTTPNGTTAENVSLNLTGLTPSTTYHYRISTNNLGGTINGTNVTFTTPSNVADLAGLSISTGTLAPVFASGTLNYIADVPVSTASLNLTATAANANATLKLRNNGAAWSTLTNAVVTAVPLETGLNNVQVESTAQDGTTVRLYSLQITRAASFAQWSASTGITGPTNTGPMDDFDGDGIPNVLEYALGMAGASGGGTGALVVNGTTLNATGQPISKQLPPPGGGTPEWCAVFIRRKDYVQAGLTYTANFSTDLGTWETSTETPTVLADDGIYQAVCVPYPEIEGQPARFFKLGVTINP
jgi:uncharacterized repeat protein (TIGR03803 family)